MSGDDQKWIVFADELPKALGLFGLKEMPADVKAWATEAAKKATAEDVELLLDSMQLHPEKVARISGAAYIGRFYSADFTKDPADREMVIKVLPAIAVADAEEACNTLYRINSLKKYEVVISEHTIRKLGKQYDVDVSPHLNTR